MNFTTKNCVIFQFLFNSEQLIVFCHAVGTAEGAGFDLSGVGRYSDVRNGGVFRFPGAVGNNGGVFVVLGQLHRVQRFRQGADLVDLDQHGVRHMAGDAQVEEFHVGNEEVVSDELGVVAHGLW